MDDLLNIDNDYFDGLSSQIYLSDLQLSKANSSETEAPFSDLQNFVYFRWVFSCKIYYKRDYFDFEIVNFPYLDGDVPRRPSMFIYCN